MENMNITIKCMISWRGHLFFFFLLRIFQGKNPVKIAAATCSWVGGTTSSCKAKTCNVSGEQEGIRVYLVFRANVEL